MYGYIYETTNLVNGKKYIGKHVSKSFDKNYYGSGRTFRKDFNKLGKSKFKVRVLEKCNTVDELNIKETYYIKLFDAVKSYKYYNNSYGGESEGWEGVNKAIRDTGVTPSKFKGKHHSENSKKKISESLLGRPSPRKGSKISENQRQAIIESNKRRKGIKFSEQAKRNMSEGCKGRKMSTSQKDSIRKKMSGRKHITNGKENKFIKLVDLDFYLSNGWRLGQTNRR